jgi:hypothetical protein
LYILSFFYLHNNSLGIFLSYVGNIVAKDTGKALVKPKNGGMIWHEKTEETPAW